MTQRRTEPRALTLTFPHADQPYLVLEGKKYLLRNFSERGIGIWMGTECPYAAGAQVHGAITMGTQVYQVRLEVRHQEGRVLGLKIESADPSLLRTFAELLEPSRLAASLQLRAATTEDTHTGYSRLWFQAPDGSAELVIWYNDLVRMIVSVQAIWAGKWAYRAQFQKVETGFLQNERRQAQKGCLVSQEEILIHHETANPDLLQQASQFVSASPPPVPGYLLWQFLQTGEQVYLPLEFFEKISQEKQQAG